MCVNAETVQPIKGELMTATQCPNVFSPIKTEKLQRVKPIEALQQWIDRLGI